MEKNGGKKIKHIEILAQNQNAMKKISQEVVEED